MVELEGYRTPNNNPLIVLQVEINVEILKACCGQHAIIHKSIKQSYVSNHYYERVKKQLLLISNDITHKEELSSKITSKAIFCKEAKLI